MGSIRILSQKKRGPRATLPERFGGSTQLESSGPRLRTLRVLRCFVWPFWIEHGDSHRDYDDVHREHVIFYREIHDFHRENIFFFKHNRGNDDFHRDNNDVHREHDDFHGENHDFHGDKMVAVTGKLELLATFLWIILRLSFHWLFVSP